MRKFVIALVALGASVGPSLTVQAANRHVDIINKTGMSLTHFYASTTGTRKWEEDILGKDVVADGETFDINIDDGSGACAFDFRAVFDNGAELVKSNIDVCQISSFTYTR